MIRCLICSNSIEQKLTLADILYWRPLQSDLICDHCRRAFEYLSAPTCCQCGRSLATDPALISAPSTSGADLLCIDCRQWRDDRDWYFVNQALFHYDKHFRQWLILLKGKGDLRLAGLFAPKLQEIEHRHRATCWVPIPSSATNLNQRGFHQTEEILKMSHIPFQPLLAYTGHEGVQKQALKSKRERMQRQNPFRIQEPFRSNMPQRVILFDDVYTTGTTMHQASVMLRAAGVQSVSGITLAR